MNITIEQAYKTSSTAIHIKIYADRMELLNPSKLTIQVHAQPPYVHPRMLIGDFDAAEQILKQLIAQSNKSFRQNTAFVQAMERIEHGITEVEIRVLKELVYSSGFRSVQVYDATGHLAESISSSTSTKQGLNFQLIFIIIFIIVGGLIFWQTI